MAQKYSKIIEKLGRRRVKLNEPMAKHTTFKIGGPADLFYEARTTKELVEAVKLARKLEIPYFILGGGSNLLVADGGFRGMAIKIKNEKLKIKNYNKKLKIICEAGLMLSRLVGEAAQKGAGGLEFAAGIPGTVGGAVRGNAGAWQQAIGDKIVRVKILTPKGKIKWIKAADCQFSYRQSRFKKTREIILGVELELEKGNKKEVEAKIKENLAKRASQPKEPSAGCIFVNPKPLSAGELIDKCGLKGKRIGDAQISPKHANFIVNLGKAKAGEVIKLIKLIKKKVKDKFGINLEEEICFVGFDKISQKEALWQNS
ncbi:MAG: UDP-N-acetylmuramate dehydrogenase [Microgenomates group bacterium]